MNLLQQQQQYNWNSLQTPGSHKQNFHPQYLQNLNPLNPDTDQICEQIYKRILDMSGNIQERYLKICDNMKIEPRDIMLKKVEDFSQNGKIDQDLAKVRYEHYNNKRKAKLIILNNAIYQDEQAGKALKKYNNEESPNKRQNDSILIEKSNQGQFFISQGAAIIVRIKPFWEKKQKQLNLKYWFLLIQRIVQQKLEQ